MSQQELLTAVAAALDRIGIQYMVTGSIASSLYGEPRLSHDIDVLVHTASGDKLDSRMPSHHGARSPQCGSPCRPPWDPAARRCARTAPRAV